MLETSSAQEVVQWLCSNATFRCVCAISPFISCGSFSHLTILFRSLLVFQIQLVTEWKRFVLETSSAQGVKPGF